MQANNNILDLLKEKASEAAHKLRRGVILQPGAIGDCILTLPLAQIMKDSLDLGAVDIIGHTEYTGILPGRTCIDGIRSMESLDLHRLFAESSSFDVTDGDALINDFGEYSYVVTFLGEPGSNFEQNLIFTVNCSHSADVITLSLKPPERYSKHITEYYTQGLLEQIAISPERCRVNQSSILIRAAESDINEGRDLLNEEGIGLSGKLVILHPGSGSLEKSWHLENFLAVGNDLLSKNMKVIFLLGPAEVERFSKKQLEKIKSVGKCFTDLSMRRVLGLLSCADAYLGNDSGITHLAAALGVRTIAVFGPTAPDVYKPIGPSVTVFSSDIPLFAEKPSVKLQRQILDVLPT